MHNQRRLRQGGYLAAVTAVVAAIVLLVNLIVGQLPSNLLEFDLSDHQLYTVSDTSVEFLSTLDRDVEIVVLAEEGSVDERIAKFLDRYAALSSHITVTQVDPVAHPSAAEEYDASADSLVVRCADTGKSRAIPFSDILVYDTMYYYMYGQYYETEFDAEGQLTSAVSYVTGDNSTVLYTLENHGEGTLPTQVTDAIGKANLTLSGGVSLALDGGVPADCSLLISYAPTRDLTADELTLLEDYLDGGGQLLVLLAQTEESLPNWEALLASYGLTLADGYVADPQRFYQQLGSLYAIAPVLSASSPVTSQFSQSDLTLMLNARGLTQAEELPADVTVTPFLQTSSGAAAITADGTQAEGTYLLGAVCEKTDADGNAAGRLTVFSSASFVDDTVLTLLSNGVNLDVFLNAVTDGFEEVSNLSIPAKSLEVTYNTIRNPGLWSTLFTAVIPIGVLALGLFAWARRRRL